MSFHRSFFKVIGSFEIILPLLAIKSVWKLSRAFKIFFSKSCQVPKNAWNCLWKLSKAPNTKILFLHQFKRCSHHKRTPFTLASSESARIITHQPKFPFQGTLDAGRRRWMRKAQHRSTCSVRCRVWSFRDKFMQGIQRKLVQRGLENSFQQLAAKTNNFPLLVGPSEYKEAGGITPNELTSII